MKVDGGVRAWVAPGLRFGSEVEFTALRQASHSRSAHWSVSFWIWLGWLVLNGGLVVTWGTQP
jgi:hypothetical protein